MCWIIKRLCDRVRDSSALNQQVQSSFIHGYLACNSRILAANFESFSLTVLNPSNVCRHLRDNPTPHVR